eukprot:SAG31_NODE_11144_length_1061_cov_1.218295_1_plen_91_part_10
MVQHRIVAQNRPAEKESGPNLKTLSASAHAEIPAQSGAVQPPPGRLLLACQQQLAQLLPVRLPVAVPLCSLVPISVALPSPLPSHSEIAYA